MKPNIKRIDPSDESPQKGQDESQTQEKEKIVRGIACPQIDEHVCICGGFPHYAPFH